MKIDEDVQVAKNTKTAKINVRKVKCCILNKHIIADEKIHEYKARSKQKLI